MNYQTSILNYRSAGHISHPVRSHLLRTSSSSIRYRLADDEAQTVTHIIVEHKTRIANSRYDTGRMFAENFKCYDFVIEIEVYSEGKLYNTLNIQIRMI